MGSCIRGERAWNVCVCYYPTHDTKHSLNMNVCVCYYPTHDTKHSLNIYPKISECVWRKKSTLRRVYSAFES